MQTITLTENQLLAITEKVASMAIQLSERLSGPFDFEGAKNYLKISRGTLYKYMNTGDVRFSQRENKIWFLKTDLDAFIKKHRIDLYKLDL
jgi:hypothetical protein